MPATKSKPCDYILNENKIKNLFFRYIKFLPPLRREKNKLE
jgi:hypothetical protein